MSEADQQRLATAFTLPFVEPVTAFLSSVLVDANTCLAVCHRHVRADGYGLFQDGHRIRTSEIRRVTEAGPVWCVSTATGSLYVIVTFHQDGGKASFDALVQPQREADGVEPHVLK